jgi:IclR family pca regulon transcriptional regulator
MNDSKGLPKGSDLFVEAFARGLAVIRAFGPGHHKLTLSEVAERAGVTPAGARRLLHTLVALGYARVDGRSFALTPAVLDVGYSYLSSLSLREVATPLLDAFARDTGEVCTVSVLDRTDVVYVARAEQRSPISRRLTAGERLPAHATSSGHVLLGAVPETELADYLGQAPFERLTQWTLTQADQLSQTIHEVREQGYAIASEQLELGVCGLAVPVQDRAGEVVAALTTSLSLAKHPLEAILPNFLPGLQGLAREIGRGIPD